VIGRTSAWVIVASFCAPGALVAQTQGAAQPSQPTSVSLTLEQAIQLARDSYPAVLEQRARAAAATEGIAAARTAYLPRLDALWQENRATHNNVFGLLLPQSVVPPVSGPVVPQGSDNVWGSAGGVLLSWDAIDFGLRKANVEVARAEQTAASASVAVSELDATAAAADAYLTVLAADAARGAAQANVDRLQVFLDAVRTLVTNQLRPGADQSRAEAELALARNQVIQTKQTADLARITLAGAVGRPGARVDPDPSPLPDPLATPSVAVPVASHPAAQAAGASISVVQARETALGRAALPHISFLSAASARGSGATVPGIDPANGLWPRVPNWAAGVSISFPIMDIFTIQPRRRAEAQNEVAARAAYQQTLLTLTTAQARAAAIHDASAAIARNMATVLSAAQETELRARTRYNNGLAPITEVADAQRLLAQAESDAAVARLSVWRALLAESQAAGDLTPFLRAMRVSGGL